MTATAAEAFDVWCRFLAPTEGVVSMEPSDPGNWTSGKVGIGELKGTKFGIAASSHPGVDIANLTIDQADRIRRVQYWDAVGADALPPPVGFLLSDAGYGSGPVTAAKQFQAMLGAFVDGDIGPRTIALVEAAIAKPSIYPGLTGLDDVLEEFAARRLLFEASLANWMDAKGGWARRLFRSVAIARSLA